MQARARVRDGEMARRTVVAEPGKTSPEGKHRQKASSVAVTREGLPLVSADHAYIVPSGTRGTQGPDETSLSSHEQRRSAPPVAMY